jgi:hemoglobin-like flavoprotein
VGEKLFSELGREAPHVVHLFQRPKKLQAYMWMQAVELLVVFTEIPQDFFDALKDLTIRHVKYGVKGEYVKPFGKAILAGIEDLAGDHWNEDMCKAWANLWRRISTCVGRSLNVGVNLITVAIVNGDVDKFKYAIECAPRKDRMSWVTRVEVTLKPTTHAHIEKFQFQVCLSVHSRERTVGDHVGHVSQVYGSIMSPLYWAIRDGKFAIAQYMIQDLLAIRADRDMYYYGREHLFETHPDVIPIFCKDCPMLVEDLMDGLLWYSQHVLDGKVFLGICQFSMHQL